MSGWLLATAFLHLFIRKHETRVRANNASLIIQFKRWICSRYFNVSKLWLAVYDMRKCNFPNKFKHKTYFFGNVWYVEESSSSFKIGSAFSPFHLFYQNEHCWIIKGFATVKNFKSKIQPPGAFQLQMTDARRVSAAWQQSPEGCMTTTRKTVSISTEFVQGRRLEFIRIIEVVSSWC